MTKQTIASLSDIVHDHDLFLIDQFGVLHDGTSLYSFTIEALDYLNSENRIVVIISNSGKRSFVNVQRLIKLGIEEKRYDRMVTSGEVAFTYLKKNIINSSISSCFLVSRDGDTSAIDELDLSLVENPDAADLIMISASEGDRYNENHYRELLEKAALNKTLCICTNPDKQMLTKSGIKFGAGRIAEIYQELGGEILWIGKPHQAIYDHILDAYKHIAKNRILCIGDSIEHDIAGGKSVGLRTLLVRTGISANFNNDELTRQFEVYNVEPDFIAAELKGYID